MVLQRPGLQQLEERRRTRRYTSTLYIHRTIHGVGYNPMNDGGRYSIQSPILSNLPPTRPTLSPPFTPFPGQHFPHHPVDLRPRDPGHLFSPKPVAGSAEMLRPAGTGPRGDASPPKCGSRTRPAPRRFNFMAPFSAPGSVASMTRPVYPPGVSGSTPPVPVAVLCPVRAPMAKNARPGERA